REGCLRPDQRGLRRKALQNHDFQERPPGRESCPPRIDFHFLAALERRGRVLLPFRGGSLACLVEDGAFPRKHGCATTRTSSILSRRGSARHSAGSSRSRTSKRTRRSRARAWETSGRWSSRPSPKGRWSLS